MTCDSPGKYPLREIFRQFYPDFAEEHPSLSSARQKAAGCIMKCKTGELGYTVSICEKCGKEIIHAASCNNRSCPCCQAPMEKKWEAERCTELIRGIAYYHVVFTVPAELNPLFLSNLKILLNLLFRCVQETLLALCADPKYMGARPGIISVLHTWGQKLNFHPHIHVCVSGGGITPAGQFKETRHKGFFLPEAAVASMFRGKFLCALKELYKNGQLCLARSSQLEDPVEWKAFIDGLFQKRWMPFVKETFNGRGNAVKYLARYSFRTAIANSRIVSAGRDSVTFRYKDYADGGAEKTRTVSGKAFIGMFLMHVLPSGFHRVRYSGYLTNCRKTENLKLIHRLRNTVYGGNPYRRMDTAELMYAVYGKDICSCPDCSGRLLRLPRGMPLSMLPSRSKDVKPAMC